MTIESVPVDQLVVDAATYQFKGGGDEFGVTDRLLGVSVWDTFAAATSPLLVHRRLDGRLCVVDGHQRTGLAKRLRVPTIQAVVIDEATVTVAAARRLGANGRSLRRDRGSPCERADDRCGFGHKPRAPGIQLAEMDARPSQTVRRQRRVRRGPSPNMLPNGKRLAQDCRSFRSLRNSGSAIALLDTELL